MASFRHPCVARFCGGPSHHLNLACEVHWYFLSEATKAALAAYVRESHPRGGGVRTIPEGLMAVSYAADGAARSEWARQLRIDVAEGLFDDYPDVVRAVS